LCQYLETRETCLPKAIEIAQRAAENPPLSNFAITSVIARFGNMPESDGLFVEAIIGGHRQHPRSVQRTAGRLSE
jgi:(methylthio)acryloyl-CoA hydratase